LFQKTNVGVPKGMYTKTNEKLGSLAPKESFLVGKFKTMGGMHMDFQNGSF